MKIRSSAPTRIDLAGGTLDIWPLYHLFDDCCTLNAAIDLYATVEITSRRDSAVVVESKDLNLRERFPSINRFPESHPLSLILRTLQFYRPKKGLEIVTDCQAPAGSGIGGSSALNIALHGALNRWMGTRYSPMQMIEIAKNIETRILKVPTGWQDYFPAMYGGVRVVQPAMTGMTTVSLPVDLKAMTSRFVLIFTGKPRQSGINNWMVFKRTLDGDKKVIRPLEKIRDATGAMKSALEKQNWAGVAAAFADEWQARKSLAPGIRTVEMDRQIRSAIRSGALSAKVCGAGGGGCVAFCVEPGPSKAQVSATLEKQGARVLPFRFVKRGLRVQKL